MWLSMLFFQHEVSMLIHDEATEFRREGGHGLALECAAVATCAELPSGGMTIAFNQEAEQLEVIWAGSVLVEGEKITSISEMASPSEIPFEIGVEAVDCTNKIIIPGFIDSQYQFFY